MDNYIGWRASGKTTALISRAVSTGCDILAPTYPMAENIAATARDLGCEVSRRDTVINSFYVTFHIADAASGEVSRVLVFRRGRLDGIRRHDREIMIDKLAMFTQQLLEPYARIRGFSLSISREDLIMTPEVAGQWIGGELGYCSCCGHKGCASDIWNGVSGATFCPACGAKLEVTP